jgi:hypothetical protein
MKSIVVKLVKCLFIYTFLICIISCSKAENSSTPETPVTPKESFDTYGKIRIGQLTQIYKDSQLPFTMDASWGTLKNADGTITFFETAMGKSPYYYRYTGTFDNPLKTALTPFVIDYNGYNKVWPSGCWIDSFYKVSDTMLIGITHREDLYPQNGNQYGKDYYYIGVSVSKDNGKTWKYLGDVISVKGNLSQNPKDGSNVAGCPILVVGDYLYLYYDETNDAQATSALSVARAKISDLVDAVGKGTVTPFFKYYNGGWNQPGINGYASCIIPDYQFGYDFHSDAVYCKALGKYLITVQTSGLNKLLLYQSTDGVNWESNPITLDHADGFMFPYSSFVGFGDQGNDDGTVVEKEFYIYICRKKLANYNYDEIYYRKVTIE